MPNEINWGFINSGPQFESLMHILLFHINPKIRLSGRPGRDRGIDAKSENGKIIYQAKYHKIGNISDVISDAKKEFDKIKQYREESHSNYDYWKEVTEWVLISNIDINETDMFQWENEILPLFNNIGITPSLWQKVIIEAMLVDFPNIIQHFFEGRNHVVFSLSEAHDYLSARSIPIIREIIDMDVVGWSEYFLIFKSFLKNNEIKILPVIGNAGIGKSRFLYECANISIEEEPDRYVFWTVAEELNQGSWFTAIPPGSKCLIVIDEPDDVKLIERVCAQLAGYSTLDWKVIISIRKTKKNILKILNNKPFSFISEKVELEELSKDETSELILKAINFLNITGVNKDKVVEIFTTDLFFKTPFCVFSIVSFVI